MRSVLALICCCFCTLVSFQCYAISDSPGVRGAEEWELVSGDGGITLYARPEGTSGLEWLMAEMSVDSSPGAVLALLQDLDALPLWVSHYRDARLLAQSGMSSWLLYARMEAPLLMADRDAVIASRAIWNGRALWIGSRLDLTAYHPSSDTMPFRRLQACWRLQPLSDGRSQIRYQGISDGGAEPAWLAKEYYREALRTTLEGLRRQVRAMKYQREGRKMEQVYRQQPTQALPPECRFLQDDS